MTLQSEVLMLPSRTFAGLQTHFIGIQSSDANNLQVLPKLWTEFNARKRELIPLEREVAYGLCLNPSALGEAAVARDEALYLAALQVEPGTQPPWGMVVWTAAGGTHAKFSHRGRIEQIGETMKFIYGKWLLTSGYVRSAGPDIERYDSRFNAESDESVFDIFIPIERKKTA